MEITIDTKHTISTPAAGIHGLFVRILFILISSAARLGGPVVSSQSAFLAFLAFLAFVIS
jgi:hypothetical protein